MQPKELNKYAEAAREQGWRIEEIKKGYQFVPPDPNAPIVVAHKTPSSRYWEQRFVTLLKRSGFIWPWPPRKGKR